MRKKLFTLIYFLAVSFTASSQITFQKAIGIPNSTPSGQANSIEQTTDGGYIIGGYALVGTAYDVYLCKTNSYGDIMWTKTFGGADTDMGNSVKQTTDGGYVVAGSTTSFTIPQSDVYLIKTDNNGDTLWTKTYGSQFSEWGYSVQQTIDGGYIITGSIIGGVYLIKTNANGDTLWTKSYDGFAGYSVQQTTDGGYILTGDFNDNIYLLKTDSNGNVAWSKYFGGTYDGHGYAVQQTPDGGYILTGYTILTIGNNDIFLIKRILQAIPSGIKGMAGTNIDEAYSLDQTTDGGFIMAGRSGFGFYDVYVIKTDANGDTLWTKSYGQAAPVEKGYTIQQTTDGGYIIGGKYQLSAYLIKTNSTGNSGCYEGNIPITIVVPSIPEANAGAIANFTATIVGTPPTIVGIGDSSITLCTSVGINEINRDNSFLIFPNPVESKFQIIFKDVVSKGTIEIYNLIGENIYKEEISNSLQIEINIKNVSEGIYFVKVNDRENQYSKKLIVE